MQIAAMKLFGSIGRWQGGQFAIPGLAAILLPYTLWSNIFMVSDRTPTRGNQESPRPWSTPFNDKVLDPLITRRNPFPTRLAVPSRFRPVPHVFGMEKAPQVRQEV